MAPHPFPTALDDLPARKAALRAAALARRDALDPTWRAKASRQIAGVILALPECDDVWPISGYWPIRSEVDPLPILEVLHGRGRTVALPRVDKPHGDLDFRVWAPGDRLERTPFGLSEPSAASRNVLPSVLLVPLAAFDRRGGRIGYGKGYYDRTIRALDEHATSLIAIGLAFAVQEVESVPIADHDERLDVVVTEAEVIRVPGDRT